MLKSHFKMVALFAIVSAQIVSMHASDDITLASAVGVIEQTVYQQIRNGRRAILQDFQSVCQNTLTITQGMLPFVRETNPDLIKSFENKAKELESDLKAITRDLASLQATPAQAPLPPLRYQPVRTIELKAIQTRRELMLRELTEMINGSFDQVTAHLNRPASPSSSDHK